MTKEIESISIPSSPPGQKWVGLLLIFILASAFLFVVLMQYYWPGRWWNSTEAMRWKGDALTLVKGHGHVEGGGLTIDGLSGQGVALVSLSPYAFPAKNYPMVRWSISAPDRGTRVEFLWRTTENPGRVFAQPLAWENGTFLPLKLDGDANWHGQIAGLALMVRAPLDAPLKIDGISVEPVVPLSIVRHEWFGIEGWDGTSINFTGGGDIRQWLAPLPFMAGALVLALLVYGLLVWRKVLVVDARMLWGLIFFSWFALDMRWQFDLWQKLGLTQQRYAGKSWEEKHLAAEDGRLFDLMQQVRAKLPSTSARVFLFADKEYLYGRGAYHLYPFNVLGGPNLLAANQFKTGDFIVILGKDEVEYDPAQKQLKWGGQQLGADLLLLAENNVMLRVQ